MVPDDRDRARGRLRSLTAWISGISAALVGIFAGIAAVTIPGTSDASAAAPAGAAAGAGESEAPEAASTPEPVPVQPTASVPVAAPPGPPHARSGASSHR